MNKETYFIYNGSFTLYKEKILSPDNRSFKYGDGFFETIKMINGNLIFENLHFERLFSSLQTMQFDKPDSFTKEYFVQKIQELAVKNNHQALSRIRLTVFRGDGNLYEEDNTPNYIIQSQALFSYPAYYPEGLSVGIYRDVQKSCDAFSNVKSNNYLPYAMSAIWCKKQSLDDAFILNNHNRIAEATTSNIFIVKDGVIKTPALSEGCIAGVTRRYLMQCLREENIASEETAITGEDIWNADEIFLTNSGFYIQWVKQLGTKQYRNTISGNLYEQFISPLLKP